MSLIRFEIRYADGRKEIANVDGERALVGHGAHCDVRLPIDQAAAEHLAVDVVGGTVRVETKAFDPPATINGLAFTTMPITPDTAIALGSTRIFVTIADQALEGMPVAKKKKDADETSPAIKVVGVVGLLVAAYLFFGFDDAKPVVAPAQAPELFATAPSACPQSAPDQARSIAADKQDIADGKRERSPFVAKEGVQAVELYETAAACYRQAGWTQQADDATSSAVQLRASITRDFRARRVRLEHLMAVGDYDLAKKDVTVLRALTEGKQGPWVTWLTNANQIVKQKAAPK